ncbi:PepSY domain-containing protein [Pinisolibacter sp.]|uniref:PepSY domain-containing protein n=1 Tax=Pinisolibacter sp. TaxID=2172024 RepID=UPI002FDCB4CE
MILRIALTLALLGASVDVAAADDRCAVPLADWQPRSALVQKLAAEGWTVLRLKADDGCYKVFARDASGRTIKARFDPATLERVPGGRGHHGGGHDDGHD